LSGWPSETDSEVKIYSLVITIPEFVYCFKQRQFRTAPVSVLDDRKKTDFTHHSAFCIMPHPKSMHSIEWNNNDIASDPDL
jgi:hypothetical protein